MQSSRAGAALDQIDRAMTALQKARDALTATGAKPVVEEARAAAPFPAKGDNFRVVPMPLNDNPKGVA